ncbi:hypothetical protein L292_3176 [Acinetobacter junii CIP 107470 = MTCC 11364]|uniref:Zeta toxin domain-containing protein n=1 Tax=Acinetobacter junii CIP 107470 = MTCC 11364 TaxID=1217666 RepID=S7WRP2_ACIJU|nr:hypothetical protein [Acinetobacter junii]ENV52027.1 hypothetical protein F953_00517 [Acinetobacter junii CIP 107470 = MTCC 11364]EPR85846.1 hypothetical protein L292_3176 [Acinetobacter junii CIP 107470 = MTCC 11364]
MKLAIKELELGGDPEKLAVQQKVIAQVLANPQAVIDQYVSHERTFQGRYICSDMFKEMFEDFNASPWHRNKFNNAVHNTAATLAAEHFRQMVEKPTIGQPDVMFVTGIPGAGKTSTVVSNNEIDSKLKFIYEGQLANSKHPATLNKFQQCLDAGLTVNVLVVHPKPEDALENTFRRFNDPNDGRGASIQTMAKIQGNTFEGLKHIYDNFGDDVNLYIIDFTRGRDQNNSNSYGGWEYLDVLKSQGNEQQILERLEQHLILGYQRGVISHECFEQAAGGRIKANELQVKYNDANVHQQRSNDTRSDEQGRNLSPASSNTSDNITSKVTSKFKP